MNKTLEFLQGKKTYFSVAIGILYLAGVYLKFWEFDEKVIIAVGLGSIAALRSSLKNLLPVLLVGALSFSLVGCKTPAAAGKALATTVVTVDAAMKGWFAWVKAGQSTPEQEARVDKLYGQYQLAESAAENAYLTAVKLNDMSVWNTAAAALTAAQSDLVALVQSFTAVKTAPAPAEVPLPRPLTQ